MLVSPFGGRSAADHWAELRGGEIFAEYFRSDQELRGQVIEAFKANPENGRAAGALAELLLREDDPALADLLIERTRGGRYRVGTHFKLMAALASCELLIDSLAEFLEKDMERDRWAVPYWISTVVRRVKADAELQDQMFAALDKATSTSFKLTLLALLNRGAGPADNVRQYAKAELDKLLQEPAPIIGFDLASNTYRPLIHVFADLAAGPI